MRLYRLDATAMPENERNTEVSTMIFDAILPVNPAGRGPMSSNLESELMMSRLIAATNKINKPTESPGSVRECDARESQKLRPAFTLPNPD